MGTQKTENESIQNTLNLSLTEDSSPNEEGLVQSDTTKCNDPLMNIKCEEQDKMDYPEVDVKPLDLTKPLSNPDGSDQTVFMNDKTENDFIKKEILFVEENSETVENENDQKNFDYPFSENTLPVQTRLVELQMKPADITKSLMFAEKKEGMTTYRCSLCEYSSIWSSNVRVHLTAQHYGQRPHLCPHCEYRAAQYAHVREHIKTHHTGERPYACPFCKYSARQSGALRVHIQSQHTDERPFKCPHCEHTCVTSGSLRCHIKAIHTGQKPHECPHCEYRSVQATRLKDHIKAKHTGEKPHCCPHCAYRAVCTSNLKRHIIRKHQPEPPYKKTP